MNKRARSANPKTRMRVVVNGREREVTAGATVASLLGDLGLAPERTVVELNRHVLEREGYAGAALAEGDVMELVEIVGGG